MVEYETHKEALAAIEGMNGQEMLEAVVSCDWAFSRGALKNKSSRRYDVYDGEVRRGLRLGGVGEAPEIRQIVLREGDAYTGQAAPSLPNPQSNRCVLCRCGPA